MKLSMFMLLVSFALGQDDSGFIYGKVHLKDGSTYKGAIRWGNGYGKELAWQNSFDATKVDNPYLKYIDNDDLSRSGRRKSFSIFGIKIFKNTSFNTSRQFNCRFGDIKRIEAIRSGRAVITLKNNEEIEVKGSGDVGATVYVLDEDRGEIKVRWKHLETVEFLPTPKKLKKSFGLLLSGIVKTESGTFEGLIQWDSDECLDYDEINGADEDGGKIDIRFERIESIEKRNRRSSIIKLFTGKQYRVSNSNDVNSENRGILIFDVQFGQVEVKWDEFIEARFNQASNYSGLAYDDFKPAEKLKGKVISENESISGWIVFDLDESFTTDILDGKMDDIEYHIPFSLIKRIERSAKHAAVVELKSGKILELYDTTDVDENNQGILVFDSANKPVYQPWNIIKRIEF